jgi:hypothetical protein
VVLDPFLPIVQDNFGCDAKVGRGVVSTASAERGAERRALDR